MSRHAVIFEDAGWRRFYPICLTRPTFAVRIGVTTLGRRLITQVARHEIRRVDLLCRELLRPLVERDHPGHHVNHPEDGDVLFLNGRLLCLGDSFDAVLELTEKAVAVESHGELAAVRVTGAEAAGYARDLARALSRDAMPPRPTDHSVAQLPEGASLLRYPWDVVSGNDTVLRADFDLVHRSQFAGALHPDRGAFVVKPADILCRDDVQVKPGAVLDASTGPIVLGEGVRVLHQAVVTGPAYIGSHTTIRMGARIEGPVSLGPYCKVGGEVEGSILQGYANKQHEGFLGHAYLGAWTNLGAGTNNSDLKNNYSDVRVMLPSGAVDTGQRFVGLLMGDHSKTAIGTRFNTGTVVGFCCNVLSPDFPPKLVPSFTWGETPYDLDRALATARVVLERRGKVMEPADEVLFRTLFDERS